MVFTLLWIFSFGFVMDSLITLSFIAVQEKKAEMAAMYSFIIVVISLLVLENILGNDYLIIKTITYALGNAIGCWVVVWRSKHGKNKRVV